MISQLFAVVVVVCAKILTRGFYLFSTFGPTLDELLFTQTQTHTQAERQTAEPSWEDSPLPALSKDSVSQKIKMFI